MHITVQQITRSVVEVAREGETEGRLMEMIHGNVNYSSWKEEGPPMGKNHEEASTVHTYIAGEMLHYYTPGMLEINM